MPSTINPTITTYANNVVSVVSLDSTPYYMIQNSMGSFIYGLRELYLKANNNSQILQSYKFNRYDVNGMLQSFSEITTIDPYQYQTSVFAKMQKENVYLDGRTNLTFTLLPNETLFIILYTDQIANRDFVPKTNFFNEDFFNKQYDVLNDYQEQL
jgi:hypothetical protein